MPLDHDRPRGRTISLALARVPADSRGGRIGTLFLNPGGPGGSGVQQIRGELPPGLAQLHRHFDIVGFDPRGVGGSRPAIDCVSDRELAALVATWPRTLDAALAAGDRIAAGCRARTPAALLDPPPTSPATSSCSGAPWATTG